ncbi:MAG: amino acid ABC transporter permease [Chlamydiae bacterium]|nr:amino acid ABC transporter permease [Chlamydiota bacterium]
MLDFSLMKDSLQVLLQGTLVTLEIGFFSCLFGFLGGTCMGVLHSTKKPLITSIVGTYVTIIRGTPLLMQIITIFYLLPELGINISPIWSAITALSLNSVAYVSQIIRSGISSVPKGQVEAAKVLGLNPWQTSFYIILPQAIRTVLPALGNEFVTLVKDSSLASIIGVMELSKQGSIIRSRTYDVFSVLFIVGLIYLCLTSIVSFLIKLLEKKMGLYAKDY